MFCFKNSDNGDSFLSCHQTSYLKRKLVLNFWNADTCDSERKGHRVFSKNNDNNGFNTRYCCFAMDCEHMCNTVSSWVGDHIFGIIQTTFGWRNCLAQILSDTHKCIQNNDEVMTQILVFYPADKFQRFGAAADTRFMGVRDAIDDILHMRKTPKPRQNKPTNNNDNQNDAENEAKPKAEKSKINDTFWQECFKLNVSLKNVNVAIILDSKVTSSSNTDVVNTDQNESQPVQHSNVGSKRVKKKNDKKEIDYSSSSSSDGDVETNLTNNVEPTQNNTSNNINNNILTTTVENKNESVQLPQTDANVDDSTASSIEERFLPLKKLIDYGDESQRSRDFKKLLLFTSKLIDYVNKYSLTKQIYFEVIDFFKFRQNHCKMMVFYGLNNIGLIYMKRFMESNFSRFNQTHSTILKQLDKINCVRRSALQEFSKLETKDVESAFKMFLERTEWLKWKDRKQCMMTVTNGSKSFPLCRGKINGNKLVCSLHVAKFADHETNMNIIKNRLPPNLMSLQTHLTNILMFCPDLLATDIKMKNSKQIMEHTFQLWYDYKKSDAYNTFSEIDGVSDSHFFIWLSSLECCG